MSEPYLWKHANGKYYVCQHGKGRISTGTTNETEARRYLAQYAAGTLSPDAPERITIGAIYERYEQERTGKVRSIGGILDAGKHIKSGLGFLEPSHLTRGVIDGYARRRLAQKISRSGDNYSPGTIIKEIVFLRAALRLAEAEKWIDRAPIIHMPVKAPPPRDKWLTKAEANRLIDACKAEHVKLYVLMGLHTLARHQAIVTLPWKSVDLKNDIIDFGRGHGNKRRPVVPLTPQLKKALQRALKLALSDFVIEFRGNEVASIKKGFAESCRRAGLSATPHVLRHSGATWMALAGVPMQDIARYLGDSVQTTERVYAKFHPDYLRKAAKALQL